jgi:hypothetical protein
MLFGKRCGTSRWVCLGLLLCVGLPSLAEPVPLVTDRPDQTESSAVVPAGSLQLELGTTFARESGESRALSYPELLARWGVHERFELRFGIAGWTTEFEGPNETRFEDLEFGVKVYLAEEHGWRPEMAFLGALSIPVGADDVSANRFNPAFRFAFSHTLRERVGLGYNLGMAWETEIEDTPQGRRRDTDAVFQYTAALGFELTARWGVYAEVFGDIPAESGGAAHSVNGGVTYLLRDNVQWDAFAGFGLNDAADDWFVGTGLSFRVPR